ncbi:MAG: hypothetical protein K6T81_19445, partial [Alicyclobacillus macrosporangiidus]|uniref:hypothetical protein n=1 Tax=Alicyclobacillus macrosporangiidus TaxID=392015 RepID=UPI0026EC8756
FGASLIFRAVTPFLWSHLSDSNRRPAHYESQIVQFRGAHISHPDISLRLEMKQLCEVLHRGHRDKEMIGVMKARSFQFLIASGNHGRAEALAAQAIF